MKCWLHGHFSQLEDQLYRVKTSDVIDIMSIFNIRKIKSVQGHLVT